jgi:hypothetical protein
MPPFVYRRADPVRMKKDRTALRNYPLNRGKNFKVLQPKILKQPKTKREARNSSLPASRF